MSCIMGGYSKYRSATCLHLPTTCNNIWVKLSNKTLDYPSARTQFLNFKYTSALQVMGHWNGGFQKT